MFHPDLFIKGGARLATFLAYLTDVESGGSARAYIITFLQCILYVQNQDCRQNYFNDRF